jgi:hypothetical protein
MNRSVRRTRIASVVVAGFWVSAGCAAKKQPENSQPAPQPAAEPVAVVTPQPAPSVTVRDPELERRVSRLELTLLERDAQIEELQARLDEASGEVARSMARLQSLATKAEAASGMAEAEIAQQSLRTVAGQQSVPELVQVRQLLQRSTTEFDRQNYAGAVYLANKAKNLASAGRARLVSGERESARPGEALFALPLRLQTSGRSNVRDGPGTGFKVLFTLDPGAPITALSYVDQWVRVTDEAGRGGWMFQNLIARRAGPAP